MILAYFQEVKYKKGAIIMKECEHPAHNPPVYLICKGEIRLEVSHNPCSKIAYAIEHGVDSKKVESVHNNATGMGNISRTFNRAQVMCLSTGQWLGEEVAYAQMPIIYDAIAHTETVQVLKINTSRLLEFN